LTTSARAEILLQQLLTNYPESDKIGDTAYQLGDLYESKAYKQYRRAAYYYERSFQWNPTTQLDARMKAARLYDHQLVDRKRAAELYQEVIPARHGPEAPSGSGEAHQGAGWGALTPHEPEV